MEIKYGEREDEEDYDDEEYYEEDDEEDYEEDGLENIAIITKDKEKLKEISNLIKSKVKVLTFDREDMIYNGGKVLLPAYYAKGLEFDGVILLDDFNNTPDLVKYIMCTRALHRLAVIK